jgi:acyl carrier protein
VNTSEIRLFIAELLIKHGYKMPQFPSYMPMNFDYIRAGIVDSLGLLEWVLELEDEFKVELSDDDVASVEFRTVDGLTNLIERKMR